jgi:SEC-C motif-containing protein
MEICPCNSGKTYNLCCKPYLEENEIPQNPEQLMRSRYTAYTIGNVDYIANTMKGPAAMGFEKEETAAWIKNIHWNGLKIIESKVDSDTATVEFIAHYSVQGNKDTMYEISEFQLKDGKWYYIDGITPKINRNDACPCRSQKKYKKCCGF